MSRGYQLVACMVLAGVLVPVAPGRAFPNNRPLTGLKGYYVQRVIGIPQTLRMVGLQDQDMKARIEAGLRKGGLLGEAASGAGLDGAWGGLRLDVQVTFPKDDYYGWYARLEVRECAHLDLPRFGGRVVVCVENGRSGLW